ncbi:replication/maintenance protein RepL, partial [Staphylococcus aureus]|uniref:replication/maintenance protein RepL n=1 Tax=Staphylococcus aureus TaxID=1280 RepID=UPI001C1FDF85
MVKEDGIKIVDYNGRKKPKNVNLNPRKGPLRKKKKNRKNRKMRKDGRTKPTTVKNNLKNLKKRKIKKRKNGIIKVKPGLTKKGHRQKQKIPLTR